MTPAPLLTVDDLARLLGVTPKAVYNRRHRGLLPRAIILGHSLRWRAADVEAWLSEQIEPEQTRPDDEKRGSDEQHQTHHHKGR